jgi:hypothetical protein
MEVEDAPEKAYSTLLEFYSGFFPNGQEKLEYEISIRMAHGKTREQSISHLFVELAPSMAGDIVRRWLTVRINTDAKNVATIAQLGPTE